MKVVILASGDGTRLWPVSTTKQPKQFTFLTSKTKSMVALTYERVSADTNNEVFVATRADYLPLLKKQIPSLDDEHIIIEPKRRGTANLILLAMDYLRRLKVDKNEPVAFIPSDHHINDSEGFNRSLRLAGRVSLESRQICLVGVEPQYPATQFGYIERGKLVDDMFYKVASFREKPNYKTALKYVQTGKFYWNCGIFIFNQAIFRRDIKASAPELNETAQELAKFKDFNDEAYQKYYSKLSDLFIDYVLIEKVEKLAVVNASFDWMDVGSFRELQGVVKKDSDDNYIEGKQNYLIDVKNSYIRNNGDLPVAVIGLDGVAVISTPDGILVTRLDQSQQAGQVSKEIQKK